VGFAHINTAIFNEIEIISRKYFSHTPYNQEMRAFLDRTVLSMLYRQIKRLHDAFDSNNRKISDFTSSSQINSAHKGAKP
jgi:hypothetical protein